MGHETESPPEGGTVGLAEEAASRLAQATVKSFGLEMPLQVFLITCFLVVMLVWPAAAVSVCGGFVIVPCAMQDVIVASTGRVLSRQALTPANFPRKVSPSARIIPFLRLLVLASLVAAALWTRLPQWIVIYAITWWASHSLLRDTWEHKLYEGPSYVRLCVAFIISSSCGGDQVLPLMKRWNGTLWLIVAIATVCAGLSLPQFATSRDQMFYQLTHLSLGKTVPSGHRPLPTYIQTPAANLSPTQVLVAEGAMVQACGQAALQWLQSDAPTLEGPIVWSWYQVGKVILGCPASVGIASQEVVTLELSGGIDTPAALVGTYMTGTAAVVFSEQMPLFESLGKTIASVQPRTTTGLGDYQLFGLTDGGCVLSIQPTYGVRAANLSRSATQLVLERAAADSSVVDQILGSPDDVSTLRIRLLDPTTQKNSYVTLNQESGFSYELLANGTRGPTIRDISATCPESSFTKYEGLALGEDEVVHKTAS